jgi:hypothetical protein
VKPFVRVIMELAGIHPHNRKNGNTSVDFSGWRGHCDMTPDGWNRGDREDVHC